MSTSSRSIYCSDRKNVLSQIYPCLKSIIEYTSYGRWRTKIARPITHTVSYVQEGAASLVIDKKRYRSLPETITIYSPGQKYHGANEKPYVPYRIFSYVIDFGADVILPSRFSPEGGVRARSILDTVKALAVRKESNELAVKNLLLEFFALAATPHATASQPDRNRILCRRIQDHIDAHCSEPFSLSALAEIGNLSTFRVSHLFKDITGHSPREYYHERKILAAKHLLAGTTMNITEIASELGFASVHHLSGLFTNITGHSPVAYRAQLLKVAKRSSRSRLDNAPSV
ncbi:MAG: AraC family transcriptional regulator [Spirochaetota bacterium]